jgi:uncharacterized membrane protein YhaH (DUF805 family)
VEWSVSETEENWKRHFFSAEGRISRKQWWVGQLVLVSFLLLVLFLDSIVENISGSGDVFGIVIFFIGALVFTWSGICLNAKRWHDRDKSGWWQLIGAIPLIGIWTLIENGFLRGTDGPNSYGPDPLGETSIYDPNQ